MYVHWLAILAAIAPPPSARPAALDRRIALTDRPSDRVVYAPHGLTGEESAIVEGHEG